MAEECHNLFSSEPRNFSEDGDTSSSYGRVEPPVEVTRRIVQSSTRQTVGNARDSGLGAAWETPDNELVPSVLDCDAEVYRPSMSPDEVIPSISPSLQSSTDTSVVSGPALSQDRLGSFDLHPSIATHSLHPSTSTTEQQVGSVSPSSLIPRSVNYSASSSGYYPSLSPTIAPETPSPLQSINDSQVCRSILASGCTSLPSKFADKPFSSAAVRTFVSLNEESPNISISSRSATLEASTLSLTSASSLSIDSIVIDETEYPSLLTEMQYDAVILCSETDIEHSTRFKEILSKFIKLADRREPAICMIDDNRYLPDSRSKIDTMRELINRSTYMFFFITKDFCKDGWSEFQRDECLMESIEKDERKWCVVPILTLPKKTADYEVPFGLRSLRGVDISQMLKGRTLKDIDVDTIKLNEICPYFLKNMTAMLNHGINKRAERERLQKKKLQEWIKDAKMEKLKTQLAEESEMKLKEEQRQRHIEIHMRELQLNEDLRRKVAEAAREKEFVEADQRSKMAAANAEEVWGTKGHSRTREKEQNELSSTSVNPPTTRFHSQVSSASDRHRIESERSVAVSIGGMNLGDLSFPAYDRMNSLNPQLGPTVYQFHGPVGCVQIGDNSTINQGSSGESLLHDSSQDSIEIQLEQLPSYGAALQAAPQREHVPVASIHSLTNPGPPTYNPVQTDAGSSTPMSSMNTSDEDNYASQRILTQHRLLPTEPSNDIQSIMRHNANNSMDSKNNESTVADFSSMKTVESSYEHRSNVVSLTSHVSPTRSLLSSDSQQLGKINLSPCGAASRMPPENKSATVIQGIKPIVAVRPQPQTQRNSSEENEETKLKELVRSADDETRLKTVGVSASNETSSIPRGDSNKTGKKLSETKLNSPSALNESSLGGVGSENISIETSGTLGIQDTVGSVNIQYQSASSHREVIVDDISIRTNSNMLQSSSTARVISGEGDLGRNLTSASVDPQLHVSMHSSQSAGVLPSNTHPPSQASSVRSFNRSPSEGNIAPPSPAKSKCVLS